MPVLLLPDRCDHLPHCFAATVCPNQALFYDERKKRVVVIPERCEDCRAPCLNFCDQYALKYAASLQELRLLQAELDGTMSTEKIALERLRLKQEADEKRTKQLVPEVTAASFQQKVLQAQLPVLLEVWSPQLDATEELLPTLQQLAQQYLGQLSILRVNADTEPQLVSALKVRSVPTLVFFYRGPLLDGVTGALSLTRLQSWVQDLLGQIQAREESQKGALGQVAPPAPGPVVPS